MAEVERILELEFTILEFYPDFVISEPREGVVLAGKQVADLIEACSGHYEEKHFVYISWRVNDYNVHPTIYINLEDVKNLAGIAVVSKKASSLKMAKFEKEFSKVPYKIFTELEKALEWKDSILQEKKKKADL